MTEAAVAHTNLPASSYAGTVLGLQVSRYLRAQPDVALLFISRIYNTNELLQSFKQTCNPKILIGCSSSGEFSSNTGGIGLASAVALRSDTMQFSAGVGYGLSKGSEEAARQVLSTFRGMGNRGYQYRSALLLLDILGGSVETFAQHLAAQTNYTYQFFGGGASDTHAFAHTPVFYGTQVHTDAVVALEILSNKPIGIGLRHDWLPTSEPMLVTAAQGTRIISINNAPALDTFRAYALKTGQAHAYEDPTESFFLNNLIGIRSDGSQGTEYRLRMPIASYPDGSIFCPAEVPEGSTISFMQCPPETTILSAEGAAREAVKRLQGYKPAVALFFDCPASRLRLKDDYTLALRSVQKVLPDTPYIGSQLYGQIVRAEKPEPPSFHTCTPAICIIPR
jgi:hypothetical protein